MHALRATRQHDRCRLSRCDLVSADSVRHDFGIDTQLSHAASNELGVLGAEVDNENGGAVEMLRLNQEGES